MRYGALPRWIPLLLCIATVGARCENHTVIGVTSGCHSGRAPELATGQRPAHTAGNTPDATSGTFVSTAAARRLPVREPWGHRRNGKKRVFETPVEGL